MWLKMMPPNNEHDGVMENILSTYGFGAPSRRPLNEDPVQYRKEMEKKIEDQKKRLMEKGKEELEEMERVCLERCKASRGLNG